MANPTPSLDRLASLDAEGKRKFIYPADVKGRLNTIRRVVFAVLGTVLVGLPWVNVAGRPAVLLDIPRRQFFLFGKIFFATDAWMLFFVVSGLGFTLLAATAVFGRVWCGFACPQTVFVDGWYRKIERWIEGTREERIKLEKAPWGLSKIAKKTAKHALYVISSLAIAHAILGFFFPVRTLFSMVIAGPGQHLEAFVWTMAVAGLFYFDFGWFREQFCIIMCPYGRLQSALTDEDTINVAYDVKRGEPRGKLKVLGNGDCVDCKRCVNVCPTGIDIRQGLQLECIGCTACMDACDEIMVKVGKPVGLIRMASERNLAGEKTRWIRPRTIAYAVAGLVGLTVATFAIGGEKGFSATVLRPTGAPYAVDDGTIRNVVRLRLANKAGTQTTLRIDPAATKATLVIPQREVVVPPMGTVEVPLIATVPTSAFEGDFDMELSVHPVGVTSAEVVHARFMGPMTHHEHHEREHHDEHH